MHAYIRAYKIVGLVYLLDVGDAFVDFILYDNSCFCQAVI